MSNPAKKAQVAWIEKVQERLKITSTMLDDMKAVKMLGLSAIMSDMIQKLRQVEIQTSKVYRKLLVWNVLLCKLLSLTKPDLSTKSLQRNALKTYRLWLRLLSM